MSIRNSDLDITIQSRLDTSSKAVSNIKTDINTLESGVVDRPLKLKTSLDLGSDSKSSIKRKVEALEEEIQSTPIKLKVELDSAELEELKNQFASISKEVVQLRNATEFQKMSGEMKKSTASAKELEKSLRNLASEANMVSRTVTSDTISGEALQDIQVYEDRYKRLQKIISRPDDEGHMVPEIQEDSINPMKLQKSLYEDIVRLNRDLYNIDRQLLTANDEQSAKLKEHRTDVEALISTSREMLDGQSLINQDKEKEIDLTRQLNDIKLEERQDKDISKESVAAYTRINKLNNEILTNERSALKVSEDRRAELDRITDAKRTEVEEIRESMKNNGLLVESKERELAISNELRETQFKIAQDTETQRTSRSVYTELSKLAREEAKIRRDMVGTDGEHLRLLENKLKVVTDSQRVLNQDIANDTGLYNEERHNQLLELRGKLLDDIAIKEQVALDREAIRVEKLNERIAKVDLDQVDFYDDQAIKDYTIGLGLAGDEVAKFERKIDAAGNRQIEMTTTTNLSADKMEEFKLVLDETTQGLHKKSEAIKPTSNRMLSFIQQMGVAIQKSIQWAVSMQLLYGSLRKIREGLELVSDLDKGLTQVAIVTGKTREETKQLAHEYASLAIELGKTVREIAEVNTSLVRQGLTQEESMKRMNTILKLSATGGMETAQSMQVITSAVNALGEEADKTADVLLRAGQISASSAEQIGEALTKTASSAKATELSLEELGALLSTLVEVTQESPSSLGNSLKALLARFNKINEETGEMNEELNDVHEAFNSVGIAFTDSEGQIRPFFDLLTDLNEQWDGLDKNTRMYIATSAAGKQNSCPSVQQCA